MRGSAAVTDGSICTGNGSTAIIIIVINSIVAAAALIQI